MTGEVFLGLDHSKQLGQFSVNPVDNPRDEYCPHEEDIQEPLFEGDSSLASSYFGWAIATLAIANNQDIILMFSKGQQIKFPDGSILRDV